MIEKDFVQLIKKDRYQVFLFSCPASFPFSIFLHYWFVINEKGKISRYEVLFRNTHQKNKFSHFYVNFMPPTRGIGVFPFVSKYSWNGDLEASIDGKTAEKMIKIIKNSSKNYPHCNNYNLLGPNSNTYIKWVLDHFPELKFKLSWRAIGKNYI